MSRYLENFRIRYIFRTIYSFFGCFPAFPRYFLCTKLNRKDCYSVIVFIRMIDISEKTLNFASICFESCFISIIIVMYVEQFIAFFGCFPAFPRYFLCIKLNRKDCYSVIVFIRMIVMRTVQPISEKTLNFASMLFWKLLYFHNNSVDRMFDILFSSRWGKFWPKVIQNRLVFKTKIQNISRYLKDFLRYLENVLGYLDIFWEFPER